MYIIACIENHIVYWSDAKLYHSIESAKARLKVLEEHGKKFLHIFEIMDLNKIDV
jgi:hypothetical protein